MSVFKLFFINISIRPTIHTFPNQPLNASRMYFHCYFRIEIHSFSSNKNKLNKNFSFYTHTNRYAMIFLHQRHISTTYFYSTYKRTKVLVGTYIHLYTVILQNQWIIIDRILFYVRYVYILSLKKQSKALHDRVHREIN